MIKYNEIKLERKIFIMEMIAAIDLRAGIAFEYEGGVWQVMYQDFMKPGKGNAVMRVRMKNLRTGAIIETTLNPNNKYKKFTIDKNVFMDQDDYSQLEVDASFIEGCKYYLIEGETICLVLICEDEILGVSTKDEKVALEVVQAEPAVRGNTSQSARKKVTLQTGLVIEVPLFIEEGDKIIVNVNDNSYCSRA